LREGEPVTMALYGAGYGSSSRLYEKAPAHLGMTPASYAKGGRGARIGYTIVAHDRLGSLGRLLVAATERGICMVALGDTESFLEEELTGEFPEAEIHRDDNALAGRVGAVLDLADENAPHADLPLDIRATAFQWRVWEQLRAIPRGETRSYGEIAAALGQPGAARAVGRACATNPVSLVVPCHRAVGGDGRMHGYRWGVERKQSLLERERRGG
jgi:AraC family transcriptional regulator of adaptative response/methylated-DNA-[protein]-cysteine methyltransferase